MTPQRAITQDTQQPLGRRLAGIAAFITAVLVAPLASAQSSTAHYTVRFDATWSAASHPAEFPPGPHFSALIGATHKPELRMWDTGTLASHGIRMMAEEGRTRPLANEAETAIAAGMADQVLQGGGIFPSPGNVELSFEISEDFPTVTLVTMVAPSPDWFVGVSGLSLRDAGGWVDQKIVQLLAYDAGTDSGTTFLSPNLATVPPVPVRQIQTGPLTSGSYLGTFTFTRTDSDPPPALALQDGRFLVRVAWEKTDGTRGVATGSALTDDSGVFWFFQPSNLELLIKVLDACSTFDHYWVFAAGLTNVGVEIEVEDTATGTIRRWENPVGQVFEPIQSTTAFSACP
ncbi:MAG: spondin domain-containing protein [Acidobacteria bacterium]|nr:spondin domain-containing protein [Acidobacteriota bacterium]